MRRLAFTMIELVFVIVVMGILGKFGTEMLANVYQNFLHTSLQNRLEGQTEAVITQIAARLQYRIKDSVATTTGAGTTLRWVGYDIEGWRGNWNGSMNTPTWSGFIDLQPNNYLISPKSNTARMNTLINSLSYGDTNLSDAALFFIGQEGDVNGSGWGAGAIPNQSFFAHPIKGSGGQNFAPSVGNFSGVDVFEYYQLAWTAYAVDFNQTSHELRLFYDYQPWNGDTEADAKSSLLMEDVESFSFQTIGSLIKVQVCINDSNISSLSEEYAVCKEKTIF